MVASPPPEGSVDRHNLPLPTPVPTFELPDGTVNLLLLGSDQPLRQGTSNTDTIIIASINTEEKTASLLSLPRDMYVYIPGVEEMGQINTILQRENYPTGGIGRLKDAILYNFGVPIHYTAQVDFAGFKSAVDIIGGVEVAVTCELRDWRLKSPELNVNVEENWEQYTLPAGVHMMDGDLALWYARSRYTTSDFDRNRRQQQLIQALLDQGIRLGLVTEVPRLWTTYRDNVHTDLDIGRILQLAAAAPAIQENGIQHLNLSVGADLQTFELEQYQHTVFLTDWEQAQDTFRRLFVISSLNRASRTPIMVEVVNRSGVPDMAALAADNLRWYGFVPLIAEGPESTIPNTELTFFGQNFKGSYDWLVRWPLGYRGEIRLDPEESSGEVSYRVVLGEDYNSCTRHQNIRVRENLPSP
jgi:LCP family protein required for cell wall assembly